MLLPRARRRHNFFRSALRRTHPSTMAASRSWPCPWSTSSTSPSTSCTSPSTSSTKPVHADRPMGARRLMELYEPDPSERLTYHNGTILSGDIPVCLTASRLNFCILPHRSQRKQGPGLEMKKQGALYFLSPTAARAGDLRRQHTSRGPAATCRGAGEGARA